MQDTDLEAVRQLELPPLPRHVHTPLCGSRDRIVVGVDETEHSISALRWAAQEAKVRRTHLHVVRCGSDPDPVEAVRRVLDRAFDRLPVDIESYSVPSRAPEALVAASHGAALLVVGTGVEGAFTEVVRSVSRRTAAFATCPIAIIKRDQEAPKDIYNRVLVGVDDTFSARDALWWAATEARYRNSELHVIHAAPLMPIPPSGPNDLLDYLTSEILVGPLAQLSLTADAQIGDASTALSQAAQESDLLVVGARGYGLFSDVLHRSVTSNSLQTAPCPVVIAPDTREDKSGRIRTAVIALEQVWVKGASPVLWPK